MITPPYMSAYQTDRIRLPAKGTAQPFDSMQEAVVALVELLSPLLDPVNKASLVAWAMGQEGFTAPS